MKLRDITISDVTTAVRFKTGEKSWVSNVRAQHILAYQISGDFPHDFEGRTLRAKSDTILFFNKSEVYSAVQREVGESLAIHFTTTNDVDIPSFVLPLKSTNNLKSAFERLYNICMRFDPSDRHRILSMTYDLLYCIDTLRAESYHPTNVALTRVTDYIHAHYSEPISSDTLADIYGVTPRRLNDIFKARYGMPPVSYILNYRLTIAKQLLEYSTQSVSYIAATSGFSDITYFSRAFKEKVGATPSQYRKSSTAR